MNFNLSQIINNPLLEEFVISINNPLVVSEEYRKKYFKEI